MADLISSLPVEKTPADEREKYMLESFFPMLNDPQTSKKLSVFKDPAMGAIIFGLLSLPFVDQLITKVFPITSTNLYYMLFVKMILFTLLFFFVSNYKFFKK
jgi:hypothetical protein